MKSRTIMKKLLVGVLAASMVAGLSACGSSNLTQASAEGAQSVDTASGTIDTSDHEVITMLVLGNKPTNGRVDEMLEQLNTILTEKVNAELKLTYVEWADWQTQYNVQLLSGDDSLDIITTATDWLYGWENAAKGAFLPLTEDMLSTYAPQTWEQVSADDDWDICKLDDQIMFIPEDNFTQWTNQGMFYRGDWAEEAGIENGDITKFDDLTTYFQYVLDNEPDVIPWDISGKNNTEGALTGAIQSYTDYRTLIGCNAGNYEFWSTTASDPYTITSAYMDKDVMYEVADLMKEWNDMGVWREDVLNFDGDSREELYAGTSAADQHHAQTYCTTVKPNMDVKQPGSDAKFYYWGEENNNYHRDLKTHGAAAISANSKHPERALMVYDLLRNDEECYRLINYGIEGTDYVIDDDGKLSHPDGYDSSTDALGANFWCGRNDDLELKDSTAWDGTWDLYNELDENAYDYPFEALAFDVDSISATQANIGAVLSEYIPQLAFGKFDDTHAAVDEMIDKINAAGYEDAKASLQSNVDDFCTDRGISK